MLANIPWWYWRSVQNRLTKWAHLLLGGRKYTVELTTKIATGAHYPTLKRIEVNPEMFNRESIDNQFKATQGLLLHEVGHARFTDAWPDQRDNVLCELVNMLEDERMERCISTLFPGAASTITLLGDLVYRECRGGETKPEYKALNACLVWRWAHSRATEEDMFKRLGMARDPNAKNMWATIKPLVEKSWDAPNTKDVIRIAKEILRILSIAESQPKRNFKNVSTDDVPDSRPDPAEGKPSGPAIDGPSPDGTPRESKEHHSGNGRSWSKPQPYIDLENAAQPMAAKITELLKEHRPNSRPRPDAGHGRYRFANEVRNADLPFVYKAEIGQARRDLALYVLVDWSSSMRGATSDVRLALMALHLATSELDIAHAITLFGAGRDAAVDERIETIAPFTHNVETVKPFIAGYEPSAGNEYLFAALDKATEELNRRPERDKVIICIHDGQPVWSGREGRDFDLSVARITAAEKQGIKVIGLFLGEGEEELRKMQRLFPRLVHCTTPQLPDKLGKVLVNLA